MVRFFVHFFGSLQKETIRSFPFFNERCEQISQVPHQKGANEQIAHFFAKNERFAQKSDEQIPNPAPNGSTNAR